MDDLKYFAARMLLGLAGFLINIAKWMNKLGNGILDLNAALRRMSRKLI
jgi:hypothetical protein